MWEAEASSRIPGKPIRYVNPFVIQQEGNESTRQSADDGKMSSRNVQATVRGKTNH